MAPINSVVLSLKRKRSSTVITEVFVTSKRAKIVNYSNTDDAPEPSHDDIETYDHALQPLRHLFKVNGRDDGRTSGGILEADGDDLDDDLETFRTLGPAELKVLRNEHYLTMIFEQADEDTLTRAMRACDFWFQRAASVLWSDAPLIQLTPCLTHPSRVAHYVNHYREIDVGPYDYLIREAGIRPNTIFPLLRSFAIHPSQIGLCGFPDLTPFLQPSLKCLAVWTDEIRRDGWNYEGSPDYLMLAAFRCRLLDNIKISHMAGLPQSSLVKLIVKSKYLKSLTLGRGVVLDTELLLDLVSKPYLKELNFDNVPKYDADEFIATAVFSGQMFGKLSIFTAHVQKKHLAGLLRLIPNVEKLNITIINDLAEKDFILYRPIFEAIAGLDNLEYVKISTPAWDIVFFADLLVLGSKLARLSLTSYSATNDGE